MTLAEAEIMCVCVCECGDNGIHRAGLLRFRVRQLCRVSGRTVATTSSLALHYETMRGRDLQRRVGPLPCRLPGLRLWSP